MTTHDDQSKKEGPKSKNRKVVPINERRYARDCQIGDVIRFSCGGVAVVTTWLNGGPLGRWLDEDGREGDLVSFDASQPITRLRGDK